ncbi:MAG: UDP-glucose/GDP-mannose dehydrogenase family protein [Polyangia bacterium]|jgi:UDPglucose 6-dehydrogenase|nr:UDP-glucose/GDP-mannose dehydrogenase family protein [Polyangia bacterium]
MKLCVIGTGYVGLVAGAGFAEFGNNVVCCDIDAQKIERLDRGEIPIYEPGLKPLVERNAAKGRLRFTTDIQGAVGDVEVVIMAVGTPMGEDGRADLQALFAAGETVARGLRRFAVIVDKSTVPVGTAERLEAHMRTFTDVDFTVASNPEFLKEGDAVNDFMKPDRVIIGASNLQALEMLRHLYAPFVRTWDRIMTMDRRSAELTKYAANAYLATRISFMNDIAALCERLGADVDMVRRGMGSDERIGRRFLFPGIGYGGSCFPKDVSALLRQAEDAQMELALVSAADRVNLRQKSLLLHKARAHFGELKGRRMAVWGLAFKPQTDDVREAPALVVVRGLLEAGAEVVAFDPEANATFAEALGDPRVRYVTDAYEALSGADALFLCTEWQELRRPDFGRMKDALGQPVIFDGRNIYDPARLRALGFTYYGVGRLSGEGPATL